MSRIRFIHTDYLRLATPIAGIADGPVWLQQLASNAVRHAARNVIDTSIAHEVDFLLVAGGITDSLEDFPAAVEWLSHQFARLNQHGVQVVAVAKDHQEAALLEPICDLVVSPGSQFLASHEARQQCNLRPRAASTSTDHDVVICVGGQHRSVGGHLVYHALPSLESSENCGLTARHGVLEISAGAVQAVGPSETQEFGCVLVDADTDHRELRSEFIVTDVIRFATEDLALSGTSTVESLSAAILEASDSFGRTMTQTAVVDWCVSAQLFSEFSGVSRLSESEMLHRLRSDVQSGHRGVWPRRIEFTAD